MINWKLRFMNKVTLVSILTLVVSIVYKILNVAGVIPDVAQQEIIDIGTMVIDVLALVGVVTDPTTTGVTDSARAMTYTTPNDEK